MILAAAMVMSVAAPAYATHGGIHPTFRQETDYFKCLASNRVQNVGRQNGEIPTWEAAAPSVALSGGGGCAMYENLLTNTGTNSSPQDLTFRGTFVGNLKTVTLEFHLAHASSFAASDGYFGISSFWVDGTELHNSSFYTFPTVSTGGPGDSTDKITFSYTKLEKLFADQDGDGDTERQIQITIASANEEQCAWLYGASDAAAKITFNPLTAAPTKFLVA
jgi:hypothetical protein